MSAGWGRNSCSLIFSRHCHCSKHWTSIHYSAISRPKPTFASFLTLKFSFAAQMYEYKVMRKVMIVPLVTVMSLGGVYCSLHRWFLSGAWDSIVNTISWSGASFYNARVCIIPPPDICLFIKNAPQPTSQHLWSAEIQRLYLTAITRLLWGRNRREFKEWCNFCLSNTSSEEWWDITTDKVLKRKLCCF